MQFTPTALDQFKKIYRTDYGIELSDADTLKLATSFFVFMEALSQLLVEQDCDAAPAVVE